MSPEVLAKTRREAYAKRDLVGRYGVGIEGPLNKTADSLETYYLPMIRGEEEPRSLSERVLLARIRRTRTLADFALVEVNA